MKELLRTTDPTTIAFATALLRGEGIEVFDMDVHMSVLEGSLGILPRRLFVADADHAAARGILADVGLLEAGADARPADDQPGVAAAPDAAPEGA